MTTTGTDNLVAVLARTELFRETPPKELREVAKHVRIVTHAAGSIITTEGRQGAGFHLVLEGVATVDAERGPVRLEAGDYFGEISLIDGLPRTATVRADTDIRTAVIAPWDFEPLLREHPTMALALLRGLAAHIRSASRIPTQRS